MDHMRDMIVTYRRALVVFVHLAMWTAALLLAVGLRFEFSVPAGYGRVLPPLLATSLFIRSLVHWRLGLFHGL